MYGLNSLLIKLDIRPPPLQVHEPQGPQNFHLFSKLPREIREKIWKLSFPDGRSIRVCPIVPKDGYLALLVRGNKLQRVLTEFSYEDNDPIVALKTSRESREIALSVYRSFVKGERIIYFCPDRDTLLFAGLETVFLMLLYIGGRPGLLRNILDHEASQLEDQFRDPSTTIKWSWAVDKSLWACLALQYFQPPSPRSGSIPSNFPRQASTSHHRIRFNVRDAFLERYGLTRHCHRGVRRRKRSGKGIWG
jgi:hypothetical protein